MDTDHTEFGYDAERWMSSLKAVSEALGENGPPVHLCLIGSAVCIFSGMEARNSRDLDVWQPTSDFDLGELETATKSAGLLFNPKGLLESETPYLQIVNPGIVQIGLFEPVKLFKLGRLIISHPPVENIIAAKLTRADAKDIQDIQFLIQHFCPDHDAIRGIIASFPARARETATENLVYLHILK